MARGFEQQWGIDYFDTFASVLKYITLRVLLAKAVANDLKIDYIDIDTTFLNAAVNEELYIEVPEFIEIVYPQLKGIKDIYLKLNKTLYGLK